MRVLDGIENGDVRVGPSHDERMSGNDTAMFVGLIR
jgi:hypothetical protein